MSRPPEMNTANDIHRNLMRWSYKYRLKITQPTDLFTKTDAIQIKKKQWRLPLCKTVLTYIYNIYIYINIYIQIILQHHESDIEMWSPNWVPGDNMIRNVYYQNLCHLLCFFLHPPGHFPSPSISVKLIYGKCHYSCTNDSELNWEQV